MAEHGFSALEIATQMGHNDNGETARRHYIRPDRERVLANIERRFQELPSRMRPVRSRAPGGAG
jgi:hypothetical protein